MYYPGGSEKTEYRRTVPAEGLLAPRDGEKLNDTRDWLFLARLLREWPQACRFLRPFRIGRNGFAYLLELPSRGFRFPLQPAWACVPEEDWKPLQPLGLPRVRTYFRSFFSFRGMLVNGNFGTLSIEAGGETLAEEGALIPRAVDEYSQSLRFPLGETIPYLEIIRSGGWSGELRDDGDIAGELYDALCPLDGPVRTVHAIIRTDRQSWRMLRGRQWGISLCPRCGGEFSSRLECMN